MKCEVSGKDWGDGHHAMMPANSWKWIKPLPMRGFQGWRYFEPQYVGAVEIVGGWLDPMPKDPEAAEEFQS